MTEINKQASKQTPAHPKKKTKKKPHPQILLLLKIVIKTGYMKQIGLSVPSVHSPRLLLLESIFQHSSKENRANV